MPDDVITHIHGCLQSLLNSTEQKKEKGRGQQV